MFRDVYAPRILVILIGVFTSLFCFGQANNYHQLEEKVYQLNNQLKFNEAQALLLPVLEADQYTADEKYQAALLLSYTYKRVFDYQSTLKYLHLAYSIAAKTDRKEAYRQELLAEEALVQFDIRHYTRSDSIMKVLEKNGYNYIDTENKAKLIMQQAYLQFLNKDYERAEKTYDVAIGLLRQVAACHLPMIYVKKMQLYDAMNQPEKLNKALQLSAHYADSCSIIKYHIYAYEELLKILEKRNDLAGSVATRKKLDSLNLIYAREEKIAALHDQKESYLLDERDKKIKQQQANTNALILSTGGLIAILAALVYWLVQFRRQKAKTDADILRMRSELEAAFANQPAPLSAGQSVSEPVLIREEATRLTAEPAIDAAEMPALKLPELSEKDIPDNMLSLINELSGRQKEVLQCMLTGMTNKEIADTLCISNNTVKYHIKNIYVLLEIKDRKDFLISVKR
ncbi:helix-turn-helix transcriptional regulator [Arsenicibacter rosenii]|nr:helix-turn-helix transcriptional regulator [Arsenicibacter rosenii]